MLDSWNPSILQNTFSIFNLRQTCFEKFVIYKFYVTEKYYHETLFSDIA